MMSKRHSRELIDSALSMYKNGVRPSKIRKDLNIPERTLFNWVNRYGVEAVETPVIEPLGVQRPQINLDIKNGTVVVFGDSHITPHSDYSVAAKALLAIIEEYRKDLRYVVNIGDTFDFASISKHPKLGWNNEFTVKEEIDAGVNFLTEVQEAALGYAECIMLEGNHDLRFNRFLANKLPQFKGIKGFDIKNHIPKGWRYGISLIINNNTIMLHSHHQGVHAAYNNTMKGGLSIITGHTHILEVKPFTDFRGTRFGVQTGTLATIQDNPLFAYTNGSPLNWQSGFAVLKFINGELQYPEVCYVNAQNQAVFRGSIVNV